MKAKDSLIKKKLITKLEKSGWTSETNNQHNYVLLEKPTSLNLPKGFHVEFSRYGDDISHVKEFFLGMKSCFQSTPAFIKYLKLIFEKQKNNLHIVLIKSERGKLASIGMVSIGTGAAFLFCGGVTPRYRGRGLSNSLMAALQMVSQQFDVNFGYILPKIEEL